MRRFLRDSAGTSAVEYALVLTGIALALAIGLNSNGDKIKTALAPLATGLGMNYQAKATKPDGDVEVTGSVRAPKSNRH